MKKYIILMAFCSAYSIIYCQQREYFQRLVALSKDDRVCLITLDVKVGDNSYNKILLSNRQLYSTNRNNLDYYSQYPDSLYNLLLIGCCSSNWAIEKLCEYSIDSLSYKYLTTNYTYIEVFKKYFSKVRLPDNREFFIPKSEIKKEEIEAAVVYLIENQITVLQDESFTYVIYKFQ